MYLGRTLGKPKAMENQNLPQLIRKSSEQVGNWIELSKVWTSFILPQIGLFAFKYKPGENPLFKADHVGVFGLLGSSLIVYIITLVVLSLTKTPTPTTSRLPLLIWHVCWSCGALTCGILSSLLFLYGWVIFCFYALFLWVAPCKPLRNLRWLRPPPNTQQHLDSVDLIVEEVTVLHPAASTLDMQESSSSTSSPSSFDKDFENLQVWKYV
ncbi:uncharacterized protein LOC109123304 [Vitis vinifera]|eukprot:XP_019078120.1 PREDICTED: uncharacterized protein LOC109123304 [Vitis vinifera]